MLDETIITETPPLYSCYGHVGEQVRVPITGNRSPEEGIGRVMRESGADMAGFVAMAAGTPASRPSARLRPGRNSQRTIRSF